MSYNSPEDKIYIKIYLSGDNAVGKNSFIQRYRDNTFSEDPPRLLSPFKLGIIKHSFNKYFTIEIWNFFCLFLPDNLLDFNVVILIFDITKAESFEFIKQQYIKISKLVKEKCIFCFIGNKSDRKNERELTVNEGVNFCNRNNIQYFECSSKTGENIEEIMCLISRDILSHVENRKEKITKFVQSISNCICF